MKLFRQLIFALVVIALIGAAGWFAVTHFLFKKSEVKADPIDTVPVEVRAIEQFVRATGEVVALQATDIKSEVSGRIEKLNAKMGDSVKEGDLLVELNSADLKSQHDEAELQLGAATIRREKISLDFERKKKLREGKFVMEKDLEDASIDLRLSENEIEISRARLQIITEKLVKTTILAPHSGTVLNVKARPGIVITGAESAGESTLLMQVAELTQLQVLSEINEVDVIKISRGLPVSVTFDSLPGVTVQGTVDSVSLSAIAKDKDKSIRVFPIVIKLNKNDAAVKSGITANVSILSGANPKAICVLTSAVFFEEGKPLVFVENGNGFTKRDVQLGISDNVHVMVVSGLKEGEKVAMQRPPAPEGR